MALRSPRNLIACVLALFTLVWADTFERAPGRCAMRGACGRKGTFGVELPCPDNGNAAQSKDPIFLALLHDLCGPDFGDSSCCTTGQLETLTGSLAQAEPLIASCPACRNNFRHFYCSFTCSPDQSLFLTVTETQQLKDGDDTKTAVKAVDFNVDPKFGKGFFDSCKDVKFGATNGLAMDLIGGGAKSWLPFLRYMGQERPLGSPFQINFPDPPPDKHTNSSLTPFHDKPRLCSSSDLTSRCACLDCPDVCSVLPPAPKPAYPVHSTCHVGAVTCFSFALLMFYAIVVVASAIYIVMDVVILKSMRKGDTLPLAWKRFKHNVSRSFLDEHPSRNGYDRVPMADPADHDESPISVLSAPPRGRSSGSNSLVGAGSTANALDGEDRPGHRPPSGSSNTHSTSPQTLRSQHRSGNSASLMDPSSDVSSNPFMQPRTYALNEHLTDSFYRLGLFCAKKPFLTLAAGLAVCGLLNIGWSRFEVERNPVRLWVAKGSESERAKSEFDQAFGPFYRTEQIFVSVAPPASRLEGEIVDSEPEEAKWIEVDEPVLNWERLQWWADVEQRVRALKTEDGITLEDVCFSPQTNPDPPDVSDYCAVQSLMGYLANDITSVDEDTWAETLNQCASSPALCLTASGQPLNPKLLFGRVPSSGGESGDSLQVDQARAFAVTFVVKNSLDPKVVAKAEKWEQLLKSFLLDLSRADGEAAAQGVQIAFSTEISLEEELNAAANTDVPIVVFSYLLMFFYVSINLGSSGAGLMRSFGRLLKMGARLVSRLARKMPLPGRLAQDTRNRSSSLTGSWTGTSSGLQSTFKRQLLVDSKFLLGMWGILIVLLSVSTSVALFSLIGVKVTLIIAEVIPFLVLAIGVDNVFILCHEVDEQNSKAYAAVSRGGGFFAHEEEQEEDTFDSLPTAEERVARALARMGPSILLSASSETIAFGLGAMVGMPAVRNFAIYAAGAVAINAALQVTVFVSAITLDLKRVESNRIDCLPCLKVGSAGTTADLGATVSEGLVARFIRTIYAPLLLKRAVKFVVVAIFGAIFVLSWISSRHISLGLDQRLALPSSSYLVPYFNAVDAYLEIGPPVYFVSDGLKLSDRAVQQRVCGRFTTCNEFSLANVLEAERKRSETSFLAEPPAVWLDDFFQWLNPVLEDCCRVSRKDPERFCTPEESELSCKPCYEDREPGWNVTMEGLPRGEEFDRFVAHWIKSPTDESCPLGGKAGYSNALLLDSDSSSVLKSQYRTFNVPLKTQDDFINALAASQRISRDLTKRTGSKVFTYSLFHVFFDQYIYIVSTTREVLTLAFLAVLAVTSLFLGSWRTGLVVTGTVVMTVLNVMGMMGAWGISLNAISLVNLVISVGIAVEFCSHIARAFMGASSGGVAFDHPAGPQDRDERARLALVDVGSSVFSGITLTKMIGIAVLALTRSKLLEMYYFRMWLSLIVSGALHGLVFLPVALSFQGGQGFALTSDEEGWLSTSIGHRYDFENRPFLHDEDDSSDEGNEYRL